MVDSADGQSIVSDSSQSGNRNDASTSTQNTPSESTQGPGGDAQGRGGLAHKETKHVNRLRLLVFLILFAAAVGIAVLVYVIARNSEDVQETTQFQASADRLVDAFARIKSERIAALASLGVASIAHGVDHSRDWPFVSLSSYQQRALTAKVNSGALQVSIAPFVSEANRPDWEAYIVSNESDVDWIEQALAYQEFVGTDEFISDYGSSFRGKGLLGYPIMHHYNDTDELLPAPEGRSRGGKGYLPIWETSPFLSFDAVNLDLFQGHANQGYYGALSFQEGGIVLGDMIYEQPGGINSPSSTTSTYAQLLSINEGREVEYPGDPMTNFFIPVFDSFEAGRKPAAVLIGLFHWGDLFLDILPQNSRGIDLVLRNTCYDPFTFRLNGKEVAPTGKGVSCVLKTSL